MPVTVIVNLRAATGGKLPRSFHCLIHAVFLERISRTNDAMGRRIHGGGAPFAISPIMGARERVIENETYWVRFSLLTEDLAGVFLDAMEKHIWNEPIRLENHRFIPEDIVFGGRPGLPWSGSATFGDLMAQGGEADRLTLFIESPVSFKRGDLHYPLPEPGLIANNLTRRWNAVSSWPLPTQPSWEEIGVSFLNLKSQPYPLRKGGTIVGVTGKLTFIGKGSPEKLRQFNTLLRFAFYAGIGVKTTQGMGMCRLAGS